MWLLHYTSKEEIPSRLFLWDTLHELEIWGKTFGVEILGYWESKCLAVPQGLGYCEIHLLLFIPQMGKTVGVLGDAAIYIYIDQLVVSIVR